MKFITSVCLSLTLLFSVTAHADDKEKLQALVSRTAKAIESAPEETIKEINNPDSTKFKDGSLYVFVYDMEGTVVAIGFMSKVMVGQNLMDKKDPDGRPFIKELRDTAKDKGQGWVDYKFVNPDTKKIQDKTSFVMKVDLKADQQKKLGVKTPSVWVGSGTYKQ